MKQADKFKKIYNDLWVRGKHFSPRNLLTIELENYHTDFLPEHQFINFESRKLNINYIKKEIQWYFKGDLYDLSICDEAKIWQNCVTNGMINSNYGYYLFSKAGLSFIVNELKRDPTSRRAVLTIYDGKEHDQYKFDTPCTLSIVFCINDNKLCMTVTMRSNDLVFGFCNDQYCFSKLQNIVANELKKEIGWYYHFAQNLHIYEKHFKLHEREI